MIRCFIRVLLRKCQLFHRFTIPAIQSAKIEYFAPKTNNSTQPKLNAACFVVQSCLADANFVVFSNYCLISTRLRARFFLRIGSCRERHRRTRRGSRIVIPRCEATWESRSTRPHRGKAIGKIATACPRLPRAQSALAMTNLLALRHRIRAAKPTACKAVTDRRYRRNWCIPFSRRPVRIGSIAPSEACPSPTTRKQLPCTTPDFRQNVFDISGAGGYNKDVETQTVATNITYLFPICELDHSQISESSGCDRRLTFFLSEANRRSGRRGNRLRREEKSERKPSGCPFAFNNPPQRKIAK